MFGLAILNGRSKQRRHRARGQAYDEVLTQNLRRALAVDARAAFGEHTPTGGLDTKSTAAKAEARSIRIERPCGV